MKTHQTFRSLYLVFALATTTIVHGQTNRNWALSSDLGDLGLASLKNPTKSKVPEIPLEIFARAGSMKFTNFLEHLKYSPTWVISASNASIKGWMWKFHEPRKTEGETFRYAITRGDSVIECDFRGDWMVRDASSLVFDLAKSNLLQRLDKLQAGIDYNSDEAIQARREKFVADHPLLSKEMSDAIRGGKLLIGMSPDMVSASLDSKIARKHTSVSKRGKSESYEFGGVRYFFIDDALESVSY